MPIPFPVQILVADDHAVVRRGLRAVLDAESDLRVVAEACDGAEAVELGLCSDVNLAVLDIAMPRLTGLQAARELSRRRPDLRTLMLSMYDKEQYFSEAIAVGASGYVLKRAADRDIVEACRAAMRGEPFRYPTTLRASARGELTSSTLTPRESEIVKLIAEGHSSRQIGDMLVISVKTVDRHRANIFDKLGMRHRGELTRYAIREGLIEA
ncbi:MAG: response regulator [Pseudonocardiaceae bacterium]